MLASSRFTLSSKFTTMRLFAVILLGWSTLTIADAKAKQGRKHSLLSDDLFGLELEALTIETNEIAKSRARRFVPFPSGSKVTLETTMSIPLTALQSSSSLKLESALTFDLPDSSTTGRSYSNRKSGERTDVYKRMENFLTDLGYNGHACTLRTLCEVSESPFEHGVYGEIINLLLSASIQPEENAIYDEYMTAEYYGKNYGNCAAIYSSCPNSVLDVVSNAF